MVPLLKTTFITYVVKNSKIALVLNKCVSRADHLESFVAFVGHCFCFIFQSETRKILILCPKSLTTSRTLRALLFLFNVSMPA
jgi:hypothetical protein